MNRPFAAAMRPVVKLISALVTVTITSLPVGVQNIVMNLSYVLLILSVVGCVQGIASDF